MALETNTKHNEGEVEKYTVTERIYLDRDGSVVSEDDPNAATLFSTPGKEIPYAVARDLGLVKETASKKAPAKKQADKPADKSRKAPAKNKSRAAKK